jgi:small multidrug resistance pump
MHISNPYLFLFLAIVFGTASNSFAKSAEGFSQLLPSLASAITIILCMYSLSNVMKVIPIGITYASFAGLCIIATAAVGIIKFNQIPNFFTIVGLALIIVGVLMVNLLGKMGS